MHLLLMLCPDIKLNKSSTREKLEDANLMRPDIEMYVLQICAAPYHISRQLYVSNVPPMPPLLTCWPGKMVIAALYVHQHSLQRLPALRPPYLAAVRQLGC